MRCSKHRSKLRLQLSSPGARQETSAEDKIRQASDIDIHCRWPGLRRRNETLFSFLHLAFERNYYPYFSIHISNLITQSYLQTLCSRVASDSLLNLTLLRYTA
jgi:hypothetical protein